jgi:D-alanyl-D-alanine dipeptidase
MPLERLTLLVVRPDEAPALIVPMLERPLAATAPAGGELDLIGWTDAEDPYGCAIARMPAQALVAVGDRIWGSHLLALQRGAAAARWTSARPILGVQRARKDDWEIAALGRAGAAADAAFADVRVRPFAGRTERAVAADLAELLVAHGHERAEFTIVGSGPNAASPHHEPTDRVIEPGDAVVLDFGGVLDDYYSDTTRTVVVGEPTVELAHVHEVVRRAQAAATDAVRPGVEIRLVDAAARGVIADAGFGEAFFHRTGHGIGLEVHEPPYAAADDSTVLEPGMTFSVEPGVYFDGRFGVRIEDIVAVTSDGVRALNTSPRELLSVS